MAYRRFLCSILFLSLVLPVKAQDFYTAPASLDFSDGGSEYLGWSASVRATGAEVLKGVPLFLKDFGRPSGRNGTWESTVALAGGIQMIMITQALPEGDETQLRVGFRADASNEAELRELEVIFGELLTYLHRRHYQLLIEEASEASEYLSKQVSRLERDSLSINNKLEANLNEKLRLERSLQLNAEEKTVLEQEQALKSEVKKLRIEEREAVLQRLQSLQETLAEID